MQDFVNGRCGWCGTDELYVKYHDQEWGNLVTDDKTLFEFLVLESAQAGLSCKQCVRMMSIYRFDDDKLEVLKILAPNISDRENYDEIINALDFISSEEKARSILGIKK